MLPYELNIAHPQERLVPNSAEDGADWGSTEY